MSEYIVQRAGVWHFQRRVPSQFAAYDKRGIVRLSTKVRVADDRTGKRAARIAERMNADLEAFWRGHARGDGEQAALNFADARKRAHGLDLDYLPVDAVASVSTDALLDRLHLLMKHRDRRFDEPTVGAVLGAVPPPVIRLSDLFGEYKAAVRAEIADFSPDQLRKWTAAKQRAVEILIEQIKDKPISEITREDALRFTDWWADRVVNDGVKIGTANKNISHIGGMLRRVIKRHRLPIDLVFAGARLEGNDDGSRPPFANQFIRDRLLAPAALAGLNDEARAVLLVMVETGARPSEIINLQADFIDLDGQIPHVRIRPDGRRLKTQQSSRDVPLVGVALEAMKGFPAGFPRYRDNGGSLSAAVNKYLEENDLRPTPAHSLYSLRHSFKDRLREAEVPEEMIDELMGHVNRKPKYGDGYGLKLKQKWLQAIAFSC